LGVHPTLCVGPFNRQTRLRGKYGRLAERGQRVVDRPSSVEARVRRLGAGRLAGVRPRGRKAVGEDGSDAEQRGLPAGRREAVQGRGPPRSGR